MKSWVKNFAFLTWVTCASTPLFAADNPIHLIVVNGVAEVSVEPNRALLQIESWARAKTAKSAQETQSQQYVKMKSVFDKFKIKKEDYRTENYSVQPEYEYDQKTQKNRMIGFRVSHHVGVTLRKPDDAGLLIDAITSSKESDLGSGISVQSVSWDSDKRTAIESTLVAEAVKNARAKAEELAKAAGVKIKAVHQISHNSGAPGDVSSARNFKAMASEAVPSTEVSGQVKIRVDVHMEFEI